MGNDVEIEMVAIPGGTFIMGSPEGEGRDNETPQHEVTVQPFLMGKYPVTQAQYKEIMGVNPSDSKYSKGDDRRPVEQVSWNDAEEFCKKLSKQTGKEYRLPSEAEWEYACRAGTTTAYYFGDSITEKQANSHWTVRKTTTVWTFRQTTTTTVGKYPPNAFGLYDMHGNVWEWCQDDWNDNYKGAPNDGSAWIFSSSNKKVIRGGSWDFDPFVCRSAARDDVFPKGSNNDIGFRVVCRVPRT